MIAIWRQGDCPTAALPGTLFRFPLLHHDPDMRRPRPGSAPKFPFGQKIESRKNARLPYSNVSPYHASSRVIWGAEFHREAYEWPGNLKTNIFNNVRSFV